MGLFGKLFGKNTGKEGNMKSNGMKEHIPMTGTSMARDPVCGMEVNKEKTGAMFLYLGQTLYFCSPSCKRLFRGNPDKYIKSEVYGIAGRGGEHHHM